MPDVKGNQAKRRPYPAQLRERAVQLVRETTEQEGSAYGVVVRIASQLGIAPDTVRTWVHRAETKDGLRLGVTADEHRRLIELERENRELRRANEILKAASAFFAAELDRHEPR